MKLSSDLISQFVKATKDTKNVKSETITYGTVVKKEGGITYVRLDGSEVETPVSSAAYSEKDDRVTVMIKNHTAVVTGNISSPSARNIDVEDVIDQISEFETLMSYKITTKELDAINATIESLKATTAKFSNMETVIADIETLQAKFANLKYVDAETVIALNADIESLRSTFGTFTDLSTEDLKAINADIDQLRAYTANFTYVSADTLHAIKTELGNADTKYANIDFSNINEITMQNFYANSGLIKDATIDDGVITGELIGVTISGDLIKANTITADKISVDDLVDFGAKIGGINISDGKLSSITFGSDNIPTGFELKSDGSFVSKGGANHDYVYNLEVKSGTIYCSSFYSQSGSFGSGVALNADGIYFKEGDSSGETLGSIRQDLDRTLYLASTNGNIVLNPKGIVEIQNGLKVTKLVGGYYQSYANEGAGSTGYLNIAEIRLTNNYQNSLIELKILRRGDNYVTKIYVRFANTNSTDPALEIFDVSNSGVKAYIAKTATATWNIYVKKSDAYDKISVLSCHYNSLYMGSEVVTYKNIFVSSLPSGYVTSGYANGFSGYHYSQVYGFHESPSFVQGRSLDGGFDFYFKENGMRIVFDGTNGKIWRVDTSGTWTTIAG